MMKHGSASTIAVLFASAMSLTPAASSAVAADVAGYHSSPVECRTSGGVVLADANGRLCNTGTTSPMTIRCSVANTLVDTLPGNNQTRIEREYLGWRSNGSGATTSCIWRSISKTGAYQFFATMSTTSTSDVESIGTASMPTPDERGVYTLTCELPTRGSQDACLYSYGARVAAGTF